MLKVAIVGCGGISRSHLNSWKQIPEAKIVGACDVRAEKYQVFVDETGCNGYLDFSAMLRREKPDIVDICLPTYLHADYAVKALKHGCHVLTEKPISLRMRDVDRVYSAARRANRRVMVAQVLRFWREYMALADAYHTGRYGRLLSGAMLRLGNMPKWSWDNWMRDPERSGLVPFDLHIHDLDFIIATFGSPKNVVCDRARNERQDYIHAIYHFDDFFIATEAAWFDCKYKFQSGFRFQFEKAVLEFKYGELTIFHDDDTEEKLADEPTGEENGINLPKTNAYYNEIRYFTDCVLAEKDCDRVKPEELKEVLRLIRKLEK